MINLTLITPTTVRVTGLDPRIHPAAWHIALQHTARLIQNDISNDYARSRTATGSRFRRNDPAYDRRKVQLGFDIRRGHLKNRIQRTLFGRDLFGVSVPTPAGTAVITMLPEMLRALQKHARWYARKKVPGRLILRVNPAIFPRVKFPLDALAVQALDPRRRPNKTGRKAADTKSARKIAAAKDALRNQRLLFDSARIQPLVSQPAGARLSQPINIRPFGPPITSPAQPGSGITQQRGQTGDIGRTAAQTPPPALRRRPLTLLATARASVAYTTVRLRTL